MARIPFVNTIGRRVLSTGAAIFMFHRVLPSGESCYEPELTTSVSTFEAVLDWLREDFEILPLQDIVRPDKRKNARKPVCSITFDDGWVDNYAYAFPLLRARGIPSTIFLPTRFIGSERRFWQEVLWFCDRQLENTANRVAVIESFARQFPWFPPDRETTKSYGALRRFLMTRPTEEAEEFTHALMEGAGSSSSVQGRAFLNWQEVREMRDSGVTFGSHTLNHVLLTQLEPSRAAAEIRDSRRELREHLDQDVPAFSYPWGAASPIARQAVIESGYRFAVATAPGGLASERDDQWFLPRIAMSDPVIKNGNGFEPEVALVSCLKSVVLARSKRLMRPAIRKEKERIKIAFVLDQISEWEGGTERQLRTLIQLLDRRYFEPELFFIFQDPNLPNETLPCAARWICPDTTRQGTFYGRLFRLARELRKFRPDVVQTFFIEGIIAGTVASRLAGVPAVVVSRRNAGHWTKRKHRVALRGIACLAHKWQSNSRAGWEHLSRIEKVRPSLIELLPNGIDLKEFTPPTEKEKRAAREYLHIDAEGPVFVSVAALVPVKDFGTLIDAMKRIEAELPAAQLLIVGDGPLRKELEQHSERLGLGHTIRFVGRQPEVRRYLAAADVGILTSKSEGSSNSVLEYMAMELPSVVSDIAPNRELVSGLFFEPGNASDLAAKLLAITRDQDLRSRLKREYSAAASQYSLERFALRAQSYYAKLAAASE